MLDILWSRRIIGPYFSLGLIRGFENLLTILYIERERKLEHRVMFAELKYSLASLIYMYNKVVTYKYSSEYTPITKMKYTLKYKTS